MRIRIPNMDNNNTFVRYIVINLPPYILIPWQNLLMVCCVQKECVYIMKEATLSVQGTCTLQNTCANKQCWNRTRSFLFSGLECSYQLLRQPHLAVFKSLVELLSRIFSWQQHASIPAHTSTLHNANTYIIVRYGTVLTTQCASLHGEVLALYPLQTKADLFLLVCGCYRTDCTMPNIITISNLHNFIAEQGIPNNPHSRW